MARVAEARPDARMRPPTRWRSTTDLKSRAEIIAARGRDIEDVDREIDADKMPRRVTPRRAPQPVEEPIRCLTGSPLTLRDATAAARHRGTPTTNTIEASSPPTRRSTRRDAEASMTKFSISAAPIYPRSSAPAFSTVTGKTASPASSALSRRPRRGRRDRRHAAHVVAAGTGAPIMRDIGDGMIRQLSVGY